MRTAIGLVLALSLAGATGTPARADDKQTTTFTAKVAPSGPLRVYAGPEGQLVALVPITDGKEMLVYARGVGGALEGKTVRYLLEDLGDGNANVFVERKRGSKSYRSVLMSERDHVWELFVPGDAGTHFSLAYSDVESRKLALEVVLKALK